MLLSIAPTLQDDSSMHGDKRLFPYMPSTRPHTMITGS
ncbi:hypothetical protein BARBAKC583_0142 [Bartonella bacilliformis KC583]|uniref:Uncharacterized protein n=1 Tax=Bartonella bacilliformis (strain ATCC 35685 / KC583 / Herrer 020/F12,63) TaxID=360095 RepID=A1UR77_BARBK|nr:hypothetical protein BARBAKC583_0142 [Bartonella bacilliformis KC583]